jgi:hypothetical protein
LSEGDAGRAGVGMVDPCAAGFATGMSQAAAARPFSAGAPVSQSEASAALIVK